MALWSVMGVKIWPENFLIYEYWWDFLMTADFRNNDSYIYRCIYKNCSGVVYVEMICLSKLNFWMTPHTQKSGDYDVKWQRLKCLWLIFFNDIIHFCKLVQKDWSKWKNIHWRFLTEHRALHEFQNQSHSLLLS